MTTHTHTTVIRTPSGSHLRKASRANAGPVRAWRGSDAPQSLAAARASDRVSNARSRCVNPSLALRALTILVAVLLIVAMAACRRESEPTTPTSGAASETASPKPRNPLVFHDEIRVADASVNDFVAKAMTTCAAGEYEAFRLLWSVREDPLPREEFEQGWQAVQTIDVRALEKVMLDADPSAGRTEPESVYALLAKVSLDPTQKVGQKEPQRHVVLMLTREHEQWRLAKAPKPMRAWIKKKIAAGDVPTEPLAGTGAD